MPFVILLQGDFFENLLFRSAVSGAVDSAPASQEGLTRIKAGSFLLDDLLSTEDNDARLVAPVGRVFLRSAHIGVLAHHHLSGVTTELDEVRLALGEGVQLLGLAGLHKENDLLVRDFVRLPPHQVVLDRLEVQVNGAKGGLIGDFGQRIIHSQPLLLNLILATSRYTTPGIWMEPLLARMSRMTAALSTGRISTPLTDRGTSLLLMLTISQSL